MMRKIKLIEPQIGEEELKRISEVLKSGYLTEGPVTKQFEEKFAETVGANHAIAVCNCTVALELALRGLKIGRGDEVIVPSFTHPATAQAVYWAGAEPVLVDVDINSYNIDTAKIEDAITKKTKAVIPVSWGGNPLDPAAFAKLKDRYGLYIIEDSACSVGAEFNGKKTGSVADVSCFSLHPRKIITTGEGGMVTTNSDEWAEEMTSLKKFGEEVVDGRLTFKRIGTNYKLSNVVSAIGLAQLEKLPRILSRRIELAENYNRLLAKSKHVKAPARDKKAKHVYQTYATYIDVNGARDTVMKEMRAKGTEVQIGTYALHLEPAFKETKRKGSLNNSEALFRNLLALPMAASMSLDDQKYVVSEVEQLVQRLS